MPRPRAPLDPFEPLGDEFDVPAFSAPPRRPATSARVKASPRPPTNRSSLRPATSPARSSRPASNSYRALPGPPRSSPLRPAPRAKPTAFVMRAVHRRILGVVLVALALLLGWNALAPRPDGVVPRVAVWGLREAFGAGAPLFALLLGAFGAVLFVRGRRAHFGAFWRGASLVFLAFLTLKHLRVEHGFEFLNNGTLQVNGGAVGASLAWASRRVLGEVGAYLMLMVLGASALLMWSEGRLGTWNERFQDLVWRWRAEWSAGRANGRRRREAAREQKRWAQGEQLELWPNEPTRPQTPRRASRSLAEIRAQNEQPSAPRSPFLDVGDDWLENEAAPVEPLSEPKAPRSKSRVPQAKEPNPSPVPDEELVVESEAKQEDPAPEPSAPRIEIIASEPPVSVLEMLDGPQEDVLSPHELLEQQAMESATEGEVEPRRPKRIEKPRRRFGDGPLMPEYFDDGVRALDPPVPPDLEGAEEELQRGVLGVQETLAAFKIDARVTDVKRGPVITRYEVQPAPGVRVAAIANLDKDLARSLSALAVRIEAPVPGKNVVGIEVPNKRVHLVRMRDVLEQHDFLSHPSKLAFVLGKDIAGQPKWGDLAKMPHMLIAGSTNSGKSVCLNSIIASILVRSGPEEVRFSLIDPKRVELTLYRGIPHLMHDVVVEPKQAVIALRRAIEEMDRRYRLFATRGVRNIASYNAKLKDGERPMPYIVIVIDELADLMMTAAAEFEKLICRLAQLARATGIHLIVATQRPSVNVITGVIKANIPARVAFAVASQVDSRTILDSVGAERLIGSGDMLYDANNGGKSTRIQGAFLSEEEVNRIVEVVKANYGYVGALDDDLPTFDLFVEDEGDEDDAKAGGFASDEKRDALFDDIVEFVLRHQEMSASNIQRKFGIGYPRAGRIVDQLERAGILGPADGPKPRKVLGRGDASGASSGEE